MRKLMYPFLLILASCQAEPLDQIVDMNKLKIATLAQAVEILGPVESREVHTGYPCENSKCEKVIFAGGKYEAIFQEGFLNRLLICGIPDLTSNDKAITTLGLPPAKPSFKNPGIVLRYSFQSGIWEINFSSDCVHIMLFDDH
jgi:hypothetical protein